MESTDEHFLRGSREIVDGNIQLCVRCPQNVVARILLARTVEVMKKVRPEVVGEFKEQLQLLQKQYPLGEPEGSLIQRMIDGALPA
jgi:hypothetical protein